MEVNIATADKIQLCSWSWGYSAPPHISGSRTSLSLTRNSSRDENTRT